MPVNRCNTLVGVRLEKLAGNKLLDCEDNPVFTSYSYRCATVLNCFHRIFDLEISAIWGEDRVLKIITSAYGSLNEGKAVSSVIGHGWIPPFSDRSLP
jgi:hypothetical protein